MKSGLSSGGRCSRTRPRDYSCIDISKRVNVQIQDVKTTVFMLLNLWKRLSYQCLSSLDQLGVGQFSQVKVS